MAEIQIRDVELEIRQRAIARAKIEGTTLQAVLRAFLQAYAAGQIPPLREIAIEPELEPVVRALETAREDATMALGVPPELFE